MFHYLQCRRHFEIGCGFLSQFVDSNCIDDLHKRQSATILSIAFKHCQLSDDLVNDTLPSQWQRTFLADFGVPEVISVTDCDNNLIRQNNQL
jgi:hypothetical protein